MRTERIAGDCKMQIRGTDQALPMGARQVVGELQLGQPAANRMALVKSPHILAALARLTPRQQGKAGNRQLRISAPGGVPSDDRPDAEADEL